MCVSRMLPFLQAVQTSHAVASLASNALGSYGWLRALRLRHARRGCRTCAGGVIYLFMLSPKLCGLTVGISCVLWCAARSHSTAQHGTARHSTASLCS
jgi:hypothetical protein